MSTVQVAALPRRFVDAFTHGVDPESGHVVPGHLCGDRNRSTHRSSHRHNCRHTYRHSHRGTDGRWCSCAAQWNVASGPPGRLTTPKRL
ncbi:hypothetical protein [Actinopolymorpha pittospori]|uniref:Uncharacterized protein n=1 Tax=Actinopolymorpha pittospori TaxID=648752 RepID=A0A927RQ17_9ACTN|nr:hypothetical protein [Actinopolymorpha pittospori]MBE1611748.1 hypothetical protein [Actinopolymorpha pittospori]